MVSSERPLVYDLRFSSVVPGGISGEGRVYELSNMDLAMKLHYIKGVYMFRKEAAEGLTIYDLKKPMFRWLEMFYVAGGRVRRSESGRPFIRCNDSGVRVVEARCDMTVDEWLEMNKDSSNSLHEQLTYSQALGPDLGFSPLVYMQMTWFGCGGMSVGLSFAHVVGDIFSASFFINTWFQLLNGHNPTKSFTIPHNRISEFPHPSLSGKIFSEKLFYRKVVDPVGDHWVYTAPTEMKTHSFTITRKQLAHLATNTDSLNTEILVSNFEVICALMWKSISKVRDMSPKSVTIFTENNKFSRENTFLGNRTLISIVEVDYSAAKAEVSELAMQIHEKKVVENITIEETVGKDGEDLDFVVYGANLTFINIEDENVYEMKLNGRGFWLITQLAELVKKVSFWSFLVKKTARER